MYSIDYVKEHFEDFEEDDIFDRRFTKRFLAFIPTEEWEKYGFKYTGETKFKPKEWTEENILEQLKEDVEFGYEKAKNERGISSCLMASVVNAWCKILQNGLNLEGDDSSCYIKHFTSVAEHYGWDLM